MEWIDFSGIQSAYPSRDEYYEFLKQQGLVAKRPDFTDNHQLVIQVHRDWHHRGAQGCRFARYMGWEPETYGWHRLVVDGHTFTGLSANDLAKVAEPVQRAIADSDNVALSLLFPDVTTPSQLAGLVRFVSRLPAWTAFEVGEDNEFVNIGIRVVIDRRKGVMAWPLALGPFDFLPGTRRAPFTELALATKPKQHPMPDEITPNDCAAHLADTWPALPMEGDKFSKMWKNTTEWKAAILAGWGESPDDLRAKARTTVTIPKDVWERSKAVI